MTLDHRLSLENIAASTRRLVMLNRLVDTSLLLTSTLDLPALLAHLMDAAMELTGTEAACILLAEPDGFRVQAAAGLGTGRLVGQWVGRTVGGHDCLANLIAAAGGPVSVDDIRSAGMRLCPVERELLDAGVVSLLGVPMQHAGQLVGVLEVFNKCCAPATDDDERALTVLAAQAANAIHTAQLVDSLEAAYDELSQLDRLKTDFLAVASHELRTPLALVMGYGTLLEEMLDGEPEEYAHLVMDAAVRLRGVLDSMADLHHIYTGAHSMKLEPARLSTLMTMAFRDVKKLADEKGQLYEMQPLEADVELMIDLPRMMSALANVLRNAVKFTPAGGAVLLSAAVGSSEVRITVQDTGCGIPADAGRRIFEAFYQAENPLTRRHEGVGLGLTIAQAVVDYHGGCVEAHSAGPGEGSCFTLRLPLNTGATG